MMDRDLAWGVEHTIQCTDDVLLNYAPETYVILLTSFTPINSIKSKKLKSKNKRVLRSSKNKTQIMTFTKKNNKVQTFHSRLQGPE